MRVIGGKARGRRLYVPKGFSVRATSDRVKESLFNIIAELSGKTFLDLYAGTGNIGIEALSRGCSRVVFVEKNSLSIRSIKSNLQLCDFQKNHEILEMPVVKGLSFLWRQCLYFDIVFADPPYEKGLVGETLDALIMYPVLSDEGLLIVEHSPRETFKGEAWELVDQRRYGETMLSFLENKNQKRE